jgi:hypothetical protein
MERQAYIDHLKQHNAELATALSEARALNANDNKIIAGLTKDLLESEDARTQCLAEKEALIAELRAGTGVQELRLRRLRRELQDEVIKNDALEQQIKLAIRVLEQGDSVTARLYLMSVI